MTPDKADPTSKKLTGLEKPKTHITAEEETRLLREAKISLKNNPIIGALTVYGICPGPSCKKPTYKISYRGVGCIICAIPGCPYGQILK